MWLFQIRPFVENKNAKGAAYLESVTPEISSNKSEINTSATIEDSIETTNIETESIDKDSNSLLYWFYALGALLIGLIIFLMKKKK